MAIKKAAPIVIGTALAGVLLLAIRAKAAPPLPEFEVEVGNLSIEPAIVNGGETALVRCTVTNIGDALGSYEVVLGGDFMAKKTVTLEPGISKDVTFSINAPSEPGVYQVTVDGLSGSLTVLEPDLEPADIRVTQIEISPTEVLAGEHVNVKVYITNFGEVRGSKIIHLTGDFTAEEWVAVNGDASTTRNFQLIPPEPGTYNISVEGFEGTFIVLAIPSSDIRITNLIIEPSEVYAGDIVSIKFTATNHGEAVGSRSVELVIS